MRHPRTARRAALTVGCALLLAAPAAAQGEGERDLTFFETLDVHVVNVEVVVTDKAGTAIRGLTRDDFELLEDGRPVRITNFYGVDAAPAPMLDPEAAVAAREIVPPAEQQLHLAIFVDGMTLLPIDRRRVFDAVRDFFDYDHARPTSLILATFDGNLTVESIPRFEPDLLNAKLEVLEQAATRGAQREMERRTVLRELEMASRNTGLGVGVSLQRSVVYSEAKGVLDSIQLYAEQLYGEARLSLEALESVVEALAGLAGRKALLYVSGGLDRYPGEALFNAWEGKFRGMEDIIKFNLEQRRRLLDTTADLKEVIRHANANRVTFYAIGAGRGGAPGGPVSAEEGGFDYRSFNAPSGGRTWSAESETIDNANLGGTLDELAAATGGLSMTRSRNFDRLLTAMSRDLGAYYSLGYTPDRGRDGKSHRLEVRVKQGELVVRHREAVRERTFEEIMNGRTRSAALLGGERNPLAVAMEFGPGTRQEDGYLVPVMVKVPLRKLVLLEQDGVHVGRLGIFICARDGEGRLSPVQSIDVPIRIPGDRLAAALEQVAGYRLILRMRPQPHSVAASVRDALGRVDSTVSELYDPTAPAG